MGGDGRTTAVATPRRGLVGTILTGEALWALTLIALGWGGYRIATTMSLQQAHDPLGGRFVPVLVSICLMLAALGALVSPVVKRLRSGPPPEGSGGGSGSVPPDEPVLQHPAVRVLLMLAISIAFISIMDVYRFIPGAIIGMAGSMWLLGERRPSRLVLTSAVTAVVVFAIFTRLLLVRLP